MILKMQACIKAFVDVLLWCLNCVYNKHLVPNKIMLFQFCSFRFCSILFFTRHTNRVLFFPFGDVNYKNKMVEYLVEFLTSFDEVRRNSTKLTFDELVLSTKWF